MNLKKGICDKAWIDLLSLLKSVLASSKRSQQDITKANAKAGGE